MEQDLIILLEKKVDGLLVRINTLEEEKRTLERELSEVRGRVQELESQKEAALGKIKSILDKIEGLSSETPSSTTDADPEGRDDSGPDIVVEEGAPGEKPLF
ncbi:MAG TPA: hypothetical protein ENJ63_03385 [Dissulfuribacter thermophilus]|uniref:Cell division protein ZapB n=1 Tax=Dissulfuribacter thermophilus TaxID=1156395 RepID=A0A7V2WT97_9BACT|nr:hypothetical protein [Dissulfuribacter thermophilus]